MIFLTARCNATFTVEAKPLLLNDGHSTLSDIPCRICCDKVQDYILCIFLFGVCELEAKHWTTSKNAFQMVVLMFNRLIRFAENFFRWARTLHAKWEHFIDSSLAQHSVTCFKSSTKNCTCAWMCLSVSLLVSDWKIVSGLEEQSDMMNRCALSLSSSRSNECPLKSGPWTGQPTNTDSVLTATFVNHILARNVTHVWFCLSLSGTIHGRHFCCWSLHSNWA